MVLYSLSRPWLGRVCITGKESDKRLHRTTLCVICTIALDSLPTPYLQMNQSSDSHFAVQHTVILSNNVTVQSLLFNLGPQPRAADCCSLWLNCSQGLAC